MRGKYVNVGDVATLVHHRGPTTLPGHPPDTSRGSTIVCLHDAGDNGNTFAGLLDALEPDHSPMAFDLPGHGRSGSLDSLDSVTAMGAHLRGLAERFDLPAPVLVGDGMGSAVALEAAMSDPAWPRALILCGGATARYEHLDPIIDRLSLVTAGRARREFDSTGYAPDTDRSVYQRAFMEFMKTDPRATLGARRAQAAWSAAGRLGAVSCPVLVVVGEHEEEGSREAANSLAGELGNARTAVLAGAGRRGVVEQPDALAALVGDFLKEVAP